MAMDQLEPFGTRGDDLRSSLSATCIVNNVRAVVSSGDAVMMDPRDMFPWMRADAARQRHDDPLDPHSPNFDPDARAAADEAVFAKLGRAR